VNTETAELADAVGTATAELAELFGISVEAKGDGGAIVTVHALEIGEGWSPSSIDLTFEIAFNYPFAAIYPYFTQPDLQPAAGQAWPSALQRVEWRGAQRTQISLRANRWHPQVDTAVGAVLQVQQWFRRT
jgi:hypothetical protein